MRLLLFLVFGALWLSGCVWLLLEHFFQKDTEFGVAPNPWQPELLRLHGWLAILAVFLLGWMTSSHVPDRWRQPRNRLSGFSLAMLAGVLALSGYALYYTTDHVHGVAAVIHEVLGVAAVGFALSHWWRANGARGA
jgi:hypothetical protein